MLSMMVKGRKQSGGMLECSVGNSHENKHGKEMTRRRAEHRRQKLASGTSKVSKIESQKQLTGEWLLGPFHARTWEREGRV